MTAHAGLNSGLGAPEEAGVACLHDTCRLQGTTFGSGRRCE